MKSVQAHYRDHLGPVYDWSLGDFEQASARAEAQLLAAGLGQGGGAQAIDLGCGSGRQTLPLLRLGYRVLATDTCPVLLEALKARPARTCAPCWAVAPVHWRPTGATCRNVMFRSPDRPHGRSVADRG